MSTPLITGSNRVYATCSWSDDADSCLSGRKSRSQGPRGPWSDWSWPQRRGPRSPLTSWGSLCSPGHWPRSPSAAAVVAGLQNLKKNVLWKINIVNVTKFKFWAWSKALVHTPREREEYLSIFGISISKEWQRLSWLRKANILYFVKGRPANIIERTNSIRECFIAKKESVPIVRHWKRYSQKS